MEKLLLTPAQVAELLGIGRTTAYDLVKRGAFPSVLVGSSVRIPAEAVRRWVDEQSTAPGTSKHQA